MSAPTSETHRPGPLRLLGILLYDSLLLLSALMVAAGLAVTLNGGEAIGARNPFFFIYLLAVAFFFYGWFWTHGGQTLGMRAWKVYLVGQSQPQVTWKQAWLRFVTALVSWFCLGLGFWWQWLGKHHQSWPDAVSDTRLVVTRAKARNG